MANRMQKMESALAGLQDLRDLSEILSVQYNPFLAAEETSPEERHSAADLLMRRLGIRDAPSRPARPPRPAPRNASPAASAADEETEVEEPEEDEPTKKAAAPAAPAPSPVPPPMPAAAPPVLAVPAKAAAPPVPVAVDTPAVPMPSPGPAPAPLPVPAATTPRPASLPDPHAMPALPPTMPGPGGLFAGPRAVGGPRETFLAIHWFTYLAEGTDPSVIFLYLDYYRDAGWFGPAEHQWLEGLAKGLATRREKANWSDYGLDARRLAQVHLRNLRVLDKLFGATLQYGEAQYLQQTLDALLGEGT